MPDSRILAKAMMALRLMSESCHQDYPDIDLEKGVLKFNCSGFISWLIRKDIHAFLEFWPDTGERPWVIDYCQRIADLEAKPSPFWLPVKTVWDIVPGDIVAWKRPMAQYERFPSGHIMLAADKAYPSHRDNEVLLTVIDSTKRPHTDDSREAPRRTGLGFGTVGIGIKEDGTPKSYYWRGGISDNEIETWVGMTRMVF